MYPKTSREIEKNIETVKMQFLTESLELVLDKEKCTGCGTCARACPKEAIVKKTLDEPIRVNQKQVIRKIKHFLIPNVRDPNKCVYCGVCTYLCPFDALRLKKDGEEVAPEKLPVVEGGALPKLEAEVVKLPSGKEAKKFASGNVTIDVRQCAGGCSNCADVCPTGAISIAERKFPADNEWQEEIVLEIQQEKCILCGACHNGCPTGALTLTIDEIHHSGSYNSPFWDDIVDRLKLNERKE